MCRLASVLAFIACIVLSGVRPTRSGDSCSDPEQSSVPFSVTSRRNEMGQWVAEVELEHGADEQDGGPWKVDVLHKTTRCAGAQAVKVSARLTAPPNRAGPGYELHRGVGYYKLHTDKKTWPEAKRTCESEAAHLVIINSEAESNVLQQFFARHPSGLGDWAFVGFHDLYAEGQYLTILDEPLNVTGFTRWSSPQQPDNAGGNPGEDCGSVHRNGGINDISCLDKYPFFCEQETANQFEGGVNIKPKVPPGYELFQSVGYYKFHPVGVIWAVARQTCAEEGAHLVIVNSENEANVLKQLFDRFPQDKLPNIPFLNSLWVGAYEQGANGQYFTIFGDPLNTTGFTRWHPGRPADPGTDNCLFVHRGTAGLYDLPCLIAAPFACELQM